MAPEIPLSYSPVTPRTPLLPRIPPKHKYCRRMKLTKRKLVPLLVFVVCSASVFRFLNISMITSNSSPRFPRIHKHKCSSTSTVCSKNISLSSNESSFTEKESRFLLQFFSTRVPCNLLVFGLERHYSSITRLNAGGFTVFLEDNRQITSTTKPAKNTQVFKIMYNTVASEAYQLLKVARENPECLPKVHLPKASKCTLVLSNLPEEVYNTMWDVVVVDGPRGDTPDSPGRMTSIYTASMLSVRG